MKSTNALKNRSALARFPRSSALRVAVTLAVIAAWLFATNHCALATMWTPVDVMHCAGEKTPAPEHQGCPEHGPDHDKKAPLACCQSLQVPAVQLAKSPLSTHTLTFAPVLYFVSTLLVPAAPQPAPVPELDTGPPGVLSFAESILQRSILAHAPPSLI